ncbi:MAG: hypothetical protein Q9160_005177 [Pyrenula sp. 1 TL-2023]
MGERASAAESDSTREIGVFEAVKAYDFSTDSEFQAGLASILGFSNDVPSTEELSQQQDLTLQAKSGEPEKDSVPVSVAANQAHDISPDASSSAPPVQSAPADGAPYPTSFSHIIDLITRNEPVPGIEQIPDTVLEADMSKPSTTPKRRKPWETNQAESPATNTPSVESSKELTNDR